MEGYSETSGTKEPYCHLEFLPGPQLSLTQIAKLLSSLAERVNLPPLIRAASTHQLPLATEVVVGISCPVFRGRMIKLNNGKAVNFQEMGYPIETGAQLKIKQATASFSRCKV